jgi:hypothetical protein
MRTFLAAAVLAVATSAVARAGDAPAPRKPSGEGAGRTARSAGPEIRWATSWREARDEAAERNVLIFLHSHGST